MPKVNWLDILVGGTAIAVCMIIILFVTSCALPVRPAKTATPVPAPVIQQEPKTVTGTIRTRHEIDAAALIAELSESGCELLSLVYEEGKRKATFTAKCRTVELPE